LRKNKLIATLSSIEVEFVIATAYIWQAIWLKKILEGMHFRQKGTITIYFENSSTWKKSSTQM
jgi:hypothetical protein